MEPTIYEFEDPLIKGQWQWRSNPNPWSRSEEAQWTSYSPEQNYLIEKAYYEQQREANVGDYIVHPQDKLQKRKDNLDAQRPVRRVRQLDVEGNERSERYFKTTTPKTLNPVFGRLEDFICFISIRNHQTLEFARYFVKIQESKDLDALNQRILPELISCLQEELKKVDSLELQNDSASLFSKKSKQKRDKMNQELISSFRQEFSSLNELYECILKAYTMNTFLYQNLNQYLRNEDWIELDNLFPYLFCLCKAFFNFKTNPISTVDSSVQNSKEPENIILYRGTALDKFSLSHYNFEKHRNFSWNTVTSTTTNLDVAKNFMYQSADLARKKYPVMFIIDVLISKTKLEYLKYMGVKLYSDKPQEDEVILPPGSVFELKEVPKEDNDGITTIKVQLSDFKLLDYRGVVMQGARQNEMIKKNIQIFKISQFIKGTLSKREELLKKLEKEMVLERLKFLSGNLFVQEIQFSGCDFDPEFMETMINALLSMKRIKKIQFRSCQFLNRRELSDLTNQKSNSQIKNVEKELEIKFIDSTSLAEERMEFVTSILKSRLEITCLSLRFSQKDFLTDNEILNLYAKGLKQLTHLRSLAIYFPLCSRLTDLGIQTLSQEGLKHLTQLTSLHLDFTRCYRISGEGFHNLCLQISNDLKALISLNLNFWWNHQITLEDLHNKIFSQKIKHLTLCPHSSEHQLGWRQDDGIEHIDDLIHLVYLHLDFSKWYCSTDKEIQNFCIQGLQHFTAFKSLNLNFSKYWKRAEEGFDKVMKIPKSLTVLTCLNLNFSRCENITDKGIHNFCMEGLRHLAHLTKLDLNFSGCSQIKDKGVYLLCAEGICYLSALKDLNLNFAECFEITNAGIASLSQFGLGNLSGLAILNINLSRCFRITEEGFYNLYTEGLNHLKALQDLNLIFWWDTHIKLQELEDFFTPKIKDLTQYFYQQKCDEIQTIPETGFRYLTHLIFLNLSFSKYNFLPNNGNQNNLMESFNHLTALTSINLDFSKYWKRAEEEILNLFMKGISCLTQLKSLNLNFLHCDYITDEKIADLWSQGLNHLTVLTSLNFVCGNITDKGIQTLCLYGLNHLTALTSLDLHFSYSREISNKGIQTLFLDGLNHLTALTSLNLGFFECEKITDREILIFFCWGLEHLTALKSLNLYFRRPWKEQNKALIPQFQEAIKKLRHLPPLEIFCDGEYRVIKTKNL